MCLLGLQEIQNYWSINNNVLDLFLQYVDSSIAQRLQGPSPTHGVVNATGNSSLEELGHIERVVPFDMSTPFAHAQNMTLEDQYLNILHGSWAGGQEGTDLGAELQINGPLQLESFDILGRSL